jgi:glycogen debranching enzyme
LTTVLAFMLALVQTAAPGPSAAGLQKFDLKSSGLRLSRAVTPAAFFDVVGRRSAAFGYEGRPFEVWVYPMKLLDDFRLSFALEGYPLEIDGLDVIASIDVRPEATTLTYSHAAFTVRQVMIAPVDEPGVVLLLDVATTRPMRITASFRPRLRLMWPAGLMTAYVSWQADAHAYAITEETGRFAGVVGAPGARDVSLMPYQEEPRDVPVRFAREIAVSEARTAFVPIVIAGSVKGARDARAVYDRLLASARDLYEQNVAYYEDLLNRTTDVSVPDDRLATAFRWAKVGVDKGLATNPFLGTGLLAGFRTSGESERPGFAWFFGRDALWSALAITSYGDFAAVRTALEFLATHQRADGKIPHEVSQSATLIPWFTDYPYPWASADATPLYVIAHSDYWRASGDTEFLQRHWESIVKAHRFSAATDTDGNELVENTGVGHGWVEGGALYPPHEELYLQGAWIEALNGLAELAGVMNDSKLAAEARGRSERTRAAVERRYWLEDRGFYAFATAPAKNGTVVAEDTVLPAVPLWWGLLRDDRAQLELDHLGSGAIATDWGARILSNRSASYDPLSYHYGSVWPLFTGWTAMAAYRYGRPHVGYQALAANALLTFDDALGYVTELLSGDFNAAFGRSSHHQIWSEAMVITPIVRGLFGVEAIDGGRALRIRPQLPADWDSATLRRVAAGRGFVDVTVQRGGGRMSIAIEQTGVAPARYVVAPAFPLDAHVRGVKVNGRPATFDVSRAGDVQRAEVTVTNGAPTTIVEFDYREGSDVYVDITQPAPGADNQGLRILRSRAVLEGLRLTVEGRGGRTYEVRLRTPRRLRERLPEGVRIERPAGDARILLTFNGPASDYVRREVLVPLTAAR